VLMCPPSVKRTRASYASGPRSRCVGWPLTLEGIKHLFSVPGVAFVICTNLDQLGRAVGAVYGPAFDGFSYLKRFFDFEYELPEPTREAFLRAHTSDELLSHFQGPSGLDDSMPENERGALRALAVIAEAMRLDLRSLQRVLTILDAAVAGAPRGARLVPLWTFFLASLRHSHPEDFHSVANKGLSGTDFANMCNKVFVRPAQVPCQEVGVDGPTGRWVSAPLASALAVLYEAGITPTRELENSTREREAWMSPYPSVLRHELLQHLPRSGKFLSIAKDAELIKAAGHIRV
jgi:hypothetical protein